MKINWDGYEAIGQGLHATVFTSPGTDLAIRLGRAEAKRYREQHDKAAALGLAVPVLYRRFRVDLSAFPERIQAQLAGHHIRQRRNGEHITDIQVMMKAEPIGDNIKCNKLPWNKKQSLKRHLWKLHRELRANGIEWEDMLLQNAGWYNGRLVVLDF